MLDLKRLRDLRDRYHDGDKTTKTTWIDYLDAADEALPSLLACVKTLKVCKEWNNAHAGWSCNMEETVDAALAPFRPVTRRIKF
jgi:hypothetical protein